MHGFRRHAYPEPTAAGDLATAGPAPEVEQTTALSDDGWWWWDGERWLPTDTDDGLWQWDGYAWQPTLDLATLRPRDLAVTVALLAEDRYARAGAILVERARDWRPQGRARELVNEASSLRRRLGRLSQSLGEAGPGRVAGHLLGRSRRRIDPDDLGEMRDQQMLLDTEHRAALVRVARGAPQRTLPEADALLEAARLLDARASRLSAALTTIEDAEHVRSRAAAAAHRHLEAAELAHRQAVRAARNRLALAEQAHERVARDTRGRLRAAIAGRTGASVEGVEPIAEVGPVRLYEGFLVTPDGRVPTAGGSASTGTAAALWRRDRDLLSDLVMLGGEEAQLFLAHLTERRRDLFLLVRARPTAFVRACRPGEEQPARRFATALNVQARLAEAAAVPLPADEVEPGEPDADPVAAAATRTVIEAREAVRRIERDPALLEPVLAARCRLADVTADPPELVEARRCADEEVRALAEPPPPLVPAGAEAW